MVRVLSRVVVRQVLLGIDVGSSSTKVALVEASTGATLGSASEAGPFVTSGGRTEASVESFVGLVGRVLGRVSEHLPAVVGVGVAGVAESGAPMDGDGRALAPVIAWHDRRGEAVAERLTAVFGPDLDRAIGQRLRYVATVAKLGWLIEHGLSASVPAGWRWLGVPELVLQALTGAEATEWSLAARTGCFDVGRREWLPDVAEAAGFEVDVFPPVRAAGEVMGRVTEAGSAWSGLPVGVPVTVAGHDHLVGFVGCDAGVDDLVDSVGTAETLVARSAALPDVSVALAAGVAVGLFPGGDGWVVLASAARSGQAGAAASATLGKTLAALDVMATGATVLAAPALVDSLRRREPPVLPAGEPADVWATLLDALAAETATAVARVTSVVGPRQRLVVFGGGSVSDPLLAAKSRRISIPVERSPVTDAAARGAALFGGIAAGPLKAAW